MATADRPVAARAGGVAMLGVGAGPDGSSIGEPALDTIAGLAARGHPRPMPRADRDAIAVLLSVHGLGPLTLGRLVTSLGSPAAILEASAGPRGAARIVEASRSLEGDARPMPLVVAQGIVDAAAGKARILAEIEREGLRIVAQGDAEFPARLMAIEVPPPALFVRGTLAPLAADHVVGVVGTRRPSPAGRRIASRIGTALARAEATVVSGLAVGIDGAAHAAAVAEQRPTVAFIGGGHGRLFPRAHDRLADAIVEGGGAVVSEYAPLVEPTKGTFPQRNRLISGTSDAVVVVEAGASSGALLTASWALEQGRECFLVPGSIDAPASAGCLAFLRSFAGEARIVAGIPELIDDLGLVEPTSPARAATLAAGPSREAILATLGGSEASVAAALVDGATTADELALRTDLPIAAVLGTLTLLEIRGLVTSAYGRYRPAGVLAAVAPVFALRREPVLRLRAIDEAASSVDQTAARRR